MLKQSKKQQHDPKSEMYRSNIKSESKKRENGDQQENVEVITVINFIEETMKIRQTAENNWKHNPSDPSRQVIQ